MNKDDRDKFFEQWLRAYADHLHVVRHGTRLDLIQHTDSKAPLPAKESIKERPQKATNH